MKNYINVSTPEGNMEFTPLPMKNGVHFIPSYESLDIQCTKEQMALWIETSLPQDLTPFLKYVPDENISGVRFEFDSDTFVFYLQGSMELENIVNKW
jgi:hypothetical protein